MAQRISRLAMATRLIAAFALLIIGFAHQPIIANPLALQFAAYTLPDGTLPVFCLTDDGSQPAKDGKGAIHDHGCDACRLSASVLLPTPPGLSGQPFRFATVRLVTGNHFRLIRALYPPNSGPRAPPEITVLA
jgi:hypothetical protein